MPNVVTTINDLEHILFFAVMAISLIAISIAIESHCYTVDAWTKKNHLVDSEKLTKFLILLAIIDTAFIFPLDASSSFPIFTIVIVFKVAAFLTFHAQFCSDKDLNLFFLADCLFLPSIFINGIIDGLIYVAGMCFIGVMAWKTHPSPTRLIAFIVSVMSVLFPVLADIVFAFSPQSEMLHLALLLLIYAIFKLVSSILLASKHA